MSVEYIPSPPYHNTQFEVGKVLYPTKKTPCIRADGILYRPESWIIFCGRCGDVWARRFNRELDNNHWTVKNWPCESCGLGSLWDNWNKAWNLSLPPKLLLREMDIIYNWHNEGIRTYEEFFRHKFFRRTV